MVNTKIIAVVLAWAFIITGTAVALNIYNTPKEEAIVIKEICNNESGLIKAAECLHKDLMTFYNYNMTNLNEKLTEEELRTKGGVCWHYAEWYYTHLKQLGYYTETYSMKTPMKGHRIATAWDSNMTAYCVLDQTEIKCTKLN